MKDSRFRAVPVTIAMRSDLLARLDGYVKRNNTSRSSFISDLIAQRLDISDVSNDYQAKEEENDG